MFDPVNPPTAGDLMNRDVRTIAADTPLRAAVAQLIGWGTHGAPVVDADGRCVGVLSMTDFANWVVDRGQERVPQPPSCQFQEKCREPGGRETTLCRLPGGACPFQRPRELADGRLALVCAEPHGIPTDWQMVSLEALPDQAVRQFMTTTVVTAELDTPVPALAQTMLERHVHRLIVLDPDRRPVGVVSAGDLLRLLANAELAAAGVPS